MLASRLAENIVHFARVLRRAGLPIGPGKVLAAVEAIRWVDLERRDDVRTALTATLLDRADQRALFDQAFALFWRDPKLLERAMHLLLPKVSGRLGDQSDRAHQPAPPNRLREALTATRPEAADAAAEQKIELDAAMTFSAREVLQHKDFETMSLEELAQAKQVLNALRLALPMLRTRRYTPSAIGPALDLRTTLRKSLRCGGEWVSLRRRERRSRPSTLVALCDISGSMTRYSRMLLHFLHALSSGQHVHVFTFGTRLTNITRALRHRDVDHALAEVGQVVPDWSGGTQIGVCLQEFNLRWSRRLLAQGATVLIVSDGLDGGGGPDVGAEMRRLRASCRRILWLNPLLRFDGFEPRAAGIRAMLPHVDRFLPAHNVASLEDLGHALAALAQARTILAPEQLNKGKPRWK